ncbi:MAG: DNA polymerase III subunit gamma/tau [Barnesiella sp.]|nr:DNA polymerase III subunit gamma/tau [Barnesiella sp.]MBD5345416.1 DNA polymerase III subunit gamma/tau [Bacteroides sp.]
MEQYIVSARKYRPSTFDSVVGQGALTATLKNAIASQRLAHSYLFCGSRGVGKTSCARIFAKTINCEHPTADGEACNECDSCRAFNEGNSLNIIELDAASNNGVDDMRQLVEQVQVPPSTGRYRVFIVDEVHMLSTAAFNAFLKTLEEPPHYVIFILATTEKHKIIPTILSRCQIYDFNRISVRDIISHLQKVAEREGIKTETAALNVIARKADGAMRDALSIFDQVAASSRGNITFQAAIDNLNVLDYNYFNRLLDCFLTGKVTDSWLIYKEIRDRGFDSHFFIAGLADYLRDLMVALDPSTIVLLETDDEARAAMAATAKKCTPDFLLSAMKLCNEADLNYREASNKQFLIELTLAKLCQLSSPSPLNAGDGEGQLKPIARPTASAAPAATPSAAQPTAPQAAPQPAPQAQPAPTPTAAPANVPPPAPRRMTPAPQRQGHAQGRAPLSFSISGRNQAAATADSATSAAAAPRTVRSEIYTDEDLRHAWQDFMNARPTERILVNTMRASFPDRIDGHSYRIKVENEKQEELMNQHMPELIGELRNALSNDNITLKIEINQGEASPHTWNDREVVAYVQQTVPALNDFIETFKLTL